MSFLSPDIYCNNCKQDIIRIKCLYCATDKFVNHICNYYKEQACCQCQNHKGAVDYYFYIKTKELFWILLYASKRYSLLISIKDNNMSLLDYNKQIFLPIDPLLTPENISQKIKTYLTFL